jgi:polyferredoxin
LKRISWQRLRQLTQVFALGLFILLFIRSVYFLQSSPLDGLFYRLDPLTAVTSMLAGRLLIPALVLAIGTVIVTLVFGRVWCGWFCPLGTILEWTSPHKKKIGAQLSNPESAWRKIKFILLLAILALAVFGNQTLLFLDPNTILTRTMAGAIWPALRYASFSTEIFLYQFKFLWPVLDAIHAGLIVPLFHNIQSVFIAAFPIFFFFLGLIALNWSAERFWCRYLCPLGGLLGWLSRFSLLRREVRQPCKQCGLCSLQCPTGTIDPGKDYRSDPAECIVCTDCVRSCNQGDVSFQWQLPHWKPASTQSYDPSRRDAMITLAAAMGGVALAGIEPIARRSPLHLIRPPGATLTDFASLCIRCGECVRVCPTQGLQPSLLDSGWQNLMTPQLVARLGYCMYNCSACIQSCPSGAIPRITLEEKHAVPMGLASINRDRCLPWAYNTPCVVCEEMCPLPDKAVVLEKEGVLAQELGQGENAGPLKPRVIREKCIGCGVCEFQCPVGGDAAIQVCSLPDDKPPLSGI